MAFWACAQLAPNHERIALHCLEHVAGFELYVPRIKPPRTSRNRAPRLLFPGYAFVLIVLQWHAASRTPGVIRLVLDGTVPARVPDRVITELRGMERKGLVQLPKPRPFHPGDRVRITRPGWLLGMECLVAGMTAAERVEVLLGVLGQARMVLPIGDVVRA
jgi:transcription antitermination factor NusG